VGSAFHSEQEKSLSGNRSGESISIGERLKMDTDIRAVMINQRGTRCSALPDRLGCLRNNNVYDEIVAFATMVFDNL
jgi:hypothetical protein